MILALDPSLSCTGICVMSDNEEVIFIDKIHTSPKDEEDKRIYTVCKYIENIIQKYSINIIALEGQYHSVNAKTGLQLSRLRGAIAYVIQENNAKSIYMQPATVRKLLTGNGRASKEDVYDYIVDKYKGHKFLESIMPFCDRSCKDKNSDIYDAISIALACYSKK